MTTPPSLTTLAEAARVMRLAVRDRSYERTPLGLYVARYLQWKEGENGARPTTISGYEAVLAKLALEHADAAVTDLDGWDGAQLIRDFWNRNWPPSGPAKRSVGTRRKNIAAIRDFTRWLYRERVLTHDPGAYISTPRRTQPDREGVFQPAEVARLLDSNPRPRDQVALRILFHLGVRRGGLVGFHLGDYDPSTATARFAWKGGGQVTLPVPIGVSTPLEELIAHRRLQNPDGWTREHLLYPEHWGPSRDPDAAPLQLLAEYRYRPMTSTTIRRWWVARLAAAGLAHHRMHTARHTALTQFLRSSGNLKLTQMLAGHKSIQTTADIYSHLDNEDLAAALERMRRGD